MVYGPFDWKLSVLHTCDNPWCVNPEHLFLGDQLTNIRDMDAKGRRARVGSKGTDHPRAKLSERDVLSIRGDLRKRSEIAKSYN